MTLAQLISITINASIFLIVLTIGLYATPQDVISLFRRPGLLVRSILSMNVIMLAFAVVVALLFDLPRAIKIALVALAVSPVPPVLPGKQAKAGGSTDYTIGLLTAAAVVAIILVPTAIEILGRTFGIDMHIPVARVVGIVLLSIAIPLVSGVTIRHLAPEFAERIARPVSILATVVLIAALVPILFTSWLAILALVGHGVLVSLILFTLVGLAVGHLLGGPDPDDRTVLALATATRHPGVALAIANLNFPGEKAVGAVVLLYLIIGAIVSVPYVTWRGRVHAAAVQKTRPRRYPKGMRRR